MHLFFFPSQAKKQQKIKDLVVASKGAEAQYIIRALSGNLRIGLQQQTAVVALAHAIILTPPASVGNDMVLQELKKSCGDDKKTVFDVRQAIRLKLLSLDSLLNCPNGMVSDWG
jgi:ATP-dependent DNA ligase